jgi:hypothetical protein
MALPTKSLEIVYYNLGHLMPAYMLAWSVKANRREPKSCLGQALNSKLTCLVS